MQYQNPKPTEGINYSQEHPLKEFSQLLIGIVVLIVVFVFTLNAVAGRLAAYIPFEFESKMVSKFEVSEVEGSAQQKYLQALADKLSMEMDLPQSMNITVHYDEADTVNAFATLGGNLIFYKGLIDKLETEQQLAAVMGHEIAHIKYRHPIVALGKGVTLVILAAFVTGASGSTAGEWLIGSSAQLSMMKFSRDQESAADEAAAAALQRVYGNIEGAKQLFSIFSTLEAKEAVIPTRIELFRSHPYSDQRWSRLNTLAKQQGWPIEGFRLPLNFPQHDKL
jgi:predicted Zn-dependent protease